MTLSQTVIANSFTQAELVDALSTDSSLILRAARDPAWFVDSFVSIESPESGGWIPFTLWQAQRDALAEMDDAQKLVILKARQLGLTWLTLSYALWLMLFRGPATVLLFSLRESEARELLRRLRLMHDHLPPPLRVRPTIENSANRWALGNGSRAIAFSTRGGRSYTGNLAIVDEADFVPHLADFLNAVKPTIDAGGRLHMISTADKAQPLSTFKRLFRAAERGENDYSALFLPWHARADRTPAWYARIAAEMRVQRGTDDDLHQEYPATAEEALRVRSLAARLPVEWVEAVTEALTPLPADAIADPELRTLVESGMLHLYVFPQPNAAYALGADPAEGNPRSDESAAIVLDAATNEQVALLAGALEPEHFARACATLGNFYHGAPILVERNNHGHTVLAHLRELGAYLECGTDGKPGWLTTAPSKALLYDALASSIREGALLIHDEESASQLASIDAVKLRAPTGLHDDRAMAFALAHRATDRAESVFYPPILPADPLDD